MVVVVVVGSAKFVVAAAGSGLATVGVPVAELAAVVTTVDSVKTRITITYVREGRCYRYPCLLFQ